jgi:hypothetical protein
MLIYQLPIGGWGKQLEDKSVVNYNLPLSKELLRKIKATGDDHATIDNNATSRRLMHSSKHILSPKIRNI